MGRGHGGGRERGGGGADEKTKVGGRASPRWTTTCAPPTTPPWTPRARRCARAGGAAPGARGVPPREPAAAGAARAGPRAGGSRAAARSPPAGRERPECFHLQTDGAVVDVRGARDHDREAVVGSVNVPAVLVTGRPLHWEREPFDGFEEAFAKAFPTSMRKSSSSGRLLDGEPDGAAVALARLAASGGRIETRSRCRGVRRVGEAVHARGEEEDRERQVHERRRRAGDDLRLLGNHHPGRRRLRRSEPHEEVTSTLNRIY